MRATPLLALLLGAALGCSGGTGGEHKGQNASRKKSTVDDDDAVGDRSSSKKKKSGSTRDDDSDDRDDRRDRDDRSERRDRDEEDDEREAGGPKGDPTDEEICDFVRSKDAAARVSREVDWLCKEGGLATLRRQAEGQSTRIRDEKQGNVFDVTMVGTVFAAGDLEDSLALGKLYCRDPDAYMEKLGRETFKDLQFMRTENAGDQGCDVHIKAKDILIIKGAEHRGKQRYYMDRDKRIFFSANYLTESINLTKLSSNVSINVVEKGKVRVYALQTVSADAKGFAGTAISKIEEGFVDGLAKSKTLTVDD